jgi:hypothetical protein
MFIKNRDKRLPNPARRHFLALTAATGRRVAALAALAAAVPLTGAQAEPGKNGPPGPIGNPNHPSCFLRGTAIQTPDGGVRIEDLRVGDLVLTIRGEAVPTRWVARHLFRKGGPSWPESVMPIRVSRDALSEGVPHSDLFLSPWHSLFIDERLMAVRDLVNGISIAPVAPEGTTIEYFNILLATHEVIFAEGAPAESLLVDIDNFHERFTNFIEYERLYPGETCLTMTPFAPIAGCYGGRAELKALFRRGVSNVVDVRDPVQRAYDRIATRSLELCGP